MPKRRQPTFRVVGYDRLAADDELAKRIYMRLGCYRFGEIPEGLPCWECTPCAHNESCKKGVDAIRRAVTADRLDEREETGKILWKLTQKIRELKKEAATCREK